MPSVCLITRNVNFKCNCHTQKMFKHMCAQRRDGDSDPISKQMIRSGVLTSVLQRAPVR